MKSPAGQACQSHSHAKSGWHQDDEIKPAEVGQGRDRQQGDGNCQQRVRQIKLVAAKVGGVIAILVLLSPGGLEVVLLLGLVGSQLLVLRNGFFVTGLR